MANAEDIRLMTRRCGSWILSTLVGTGSSSNTKPFHNWADVMPRQPVLREGESLNLGGRRQRGRENLVIAESFPKHIPVSSSSNPYGVAYIYMGKLGASYTKPYTTSGSPHPRK
jgi:hypothetical protein